MSKITIYQKPTCTTCRKVSAILKDKGIAFESVDYYLSPIPKTKLADLVKKMGIPASGLFRKKEEIYKKLKLAKSEVSDEKAITLMAKYPDLIERPIVEKGGRAVLARPPERIKEIL